MALESLWSKKSCPGEAFYRACSEHHVSGRICQIGFAVNWPQACSVNLLEMAALVYEPPADTRSHMEGVCNWHPTEEIRCTFCEMWSSFSWNREDLIETFWQLILLFTKQQEPYCQFSKDALGRKNYCVSVNKTPTPPTLGLSKAIILRFFFFLLLFRFRIL